MALLLPDILMYLFSKSINYPNKIYRRCVRLHQKSQGHKRMFPVSKNKKWNEQVGRKPIRCKSFDRNNTVHYPNPNSHLFGQNYSVKKLSADNFSKNFKNF